MSTDEATLNRLIAAGNGNGSMHHNQSVVSKYGYKNGVDGQHCLLGVCVCVFSSFPSTHKLAKKIMMTLCHVSSFLGYHQKCTDYLPSFRVYGNIYITAIFLKQKDPKDFLVRYNDGNWNFFF